LTNALTSDCVSFSRLTTARRRDSPTLQASIKNGRLLDAAEAGGFDVLITVDQHIPDQQNLAGRSISLLILCAPSNRLR
jgi:hypothetical protein